MSMIPTTSTNPVLQGGASHSPLCLYVGDWYADTSTFTTTERGAYITLLIHLFNNGGSIRFDRERIAKITGLSYSRWHDIEENVLYSFKNDKGILTHYSMARASKKGVQS